MKKRELMWTTFMCITHQPVIKVQKKTKDDNPDFKHIPSAARWPEAQWAAILIQGLTGLAQQAVDDTLPMADLGNYKKVWDTIMQTLNLSPKVYQWHLREIEFGPDYSPQMIAKKSRQLAHSG